MVDEQRDISINVRASQAITALTQLGNKLDNFGGAVGRSSRDLKKLDQTLIEGQRTMKNSARTIAQLKADMSAMSKDLRQSDTTIKTLESRMRTMTRRMEEWKAKALDLRRANQTLGKDNERLAGSFSRVERSTDGAARALKNIDQNLQLNAMRYALYDVANSFSRLRDVGVVALSDLMKTGIEFERNFANVLRTSQVSDPGAFTNSLFVLDGLMTKEEQATKATMVLRDAFLDLQSTLPVSSEELTRIGTLAAQMGIAANEVANFTEVTAKFSAASGITADEAATSLARISQMLGDEVAGDYERLASAILKTGVNAIATEEQIVRGTTQIASVGNVAGLAATDIIALSSAMSSLGMRPELQRSIVTSSFTKILTAVRGTTAEAEKFGRVMGLTGQQFKDAWDEDAYETYRRLLATIAQSPQAIGILQGLGLASQRLTPNLLKLGQAYELLGQTREDTEQGWNEDIELQRQYQIIMDTTAAKVQVLSQAWDALVAILGQDAVKALGWVADGLSEVLKSLRDFVNNPAGRLISGLILIIGGLSVVVLALVTAFTLAGASYLGFKFVLQQLAVEFGAATIAAGTFKWTLAETSTAARVGTVALTGLRTAAFALARALPPLILVSAAFAAVTETNGITEWARDMRGVSSETEVLIDQLTNLNAQGDLFGNRSFKDVGGFLPWLDEVRRGLGVLGGQGGTWGDIALLDTQLAADAAQNPLLVKAAYDELKQSWVESGNEASRFEKAFVDTHNALALVTGDTEATSDEIDAYLAGLQDTANEEEAHALRLASISSALGLVTNEYQTAEDALSKFITSFSTGAGGFVSISDMLDQAYGTDEGQGGGLARLQSDLDTNLQAMRTWSNGIQELVIRGAGSVAEAFAAQGPASQQAVADALKLGPDALAQLEESMWWAAFYASEAYANAFATDSAVLADIYAKVLEIDPARAREAVNKAREALKATGGVLDPATISALQGEYGFELDLALTNVTPEQVEAARLTAQTLASATPITIPVHMIASPYSEADWGLGQGWSVTENGATLQMTVDPNTEQGTATLEAWRAADYNVDGLGELSAHVLTEQAELDLVNFRLSEANKTLWITARVVGSSGSNTNAPKPYADGGFPGGLPKYANGISRLSGPGSDRSDSIIARLSRGEGVVNTRAVRYYTPQFIDSLNKLKFPKYANGWAGGAVSGSSSAPTSPRVHVEVTQMYPTTRDPIRKLKSDAENALAGIWED